MITKNNVEEIVEVAAQIVFEYGSTDSEVISDMYDTYGGEAGFDYDDLAEATNMVDRLRGELGDNWETVVAAAKTRLLEQDVEVEVSISNLLDHDARRYAGKCNLRMVRGTMGPVAGRWTIKGKASAVANFRKRFEYPA